MGLQPISLCLATTMVCLCCTPQKNNLSLEGGDKWQQADVVIHNFTAQGFNQAGPQWHLKADWAYIISAEKLTHLTNVQLTYFQGKEGKTLVTCKEADVDEKEQTLLLKNQVVVRSDNGRTLYAEELLWREKEQFLVSEKPVKITMPSGDIIEGKALTADNRLNRLTLKAGKGFHPMPH